MDKDHFYLIHRNGFLYNICKISDYKNIIPQVLYNFDSNFFFASYIFGI